MGFAECLQIKFQHGVGRWRGWVLEVGEGYVWWGRERLVVEGSRWVVSMWKCGGSTGL